MTELKALLDEIAAGASEREARRVAPHAQIRRIADAGLGRLRVPVTEGGAGASLRELFQFLIQLAEADSNVAHILRVHYWFVEAQLHRPVGDPRRARNSRSSTRDTSSATPSASRASARSGSSSIPR